MATAANGRQGLDRLVEGPRPDVVLLDMMMPVMNGPAMLGAMAQSRTLRGIPVIVLSSLPEQAVRARAEGFAAILLKPWTADEVLDAIARVLGGKFDAGREPETPGCPAAMSASMRDPAALRRRTSAHGLDR